VNITPIVMLNLVQHNALPPVILKQVQDDKRVQDDKQVQDDEIWIGAGQ
jgi:hypothetical protein